jgi:hypothetical protein
MRSSISSAIEETIMRDAIVMAALAFALAAPASADPLPKNEGQCVRTTIRALGTRLDGIADSGDAVSYADGGYQVSYDAIKGLRGAKAGDVVTLCLISIPDECPPGDDRGKVYRATDLRTHKSWQAPDAEHMCGGA